MGRSYDIHDIQMPGDALWWPFTLATWLSLLLILCLLAFGIWLFVYFRRKRVVYFSNRSLRYLLKRYQSDQDASAFARDVSVLLRRLYLTIGERNKIAGLSGEKWLEVLDDGLKDRPFTTGVGKVLGSAPYQRQAEYDVKSLYALCQRRIEAMRVN